MIDQSTICRWCNGEGIARIEGVPVACICAPHQPNSSLDDDRSPFADTRTEPSDGQV